MMNDLYQLCMQQIELTLEDFEKCCNAKKLQCDISLEEKMNTDVAFVVMVSIKVNLDEEKIKKAWKKIQQDIKFKIGRGLSSVEFIDVNVKRKYNEYSYLIMMFR